MKTLDGLMAFLARRLTEEQYRALTQRAASQGLGLRDYVGRYVLKMAERRFVERQDMPVVQQPSVIVDARYVASLPREID